MRACGLLVAITGYSLAVTGAPSPLGELLFAEGFLELFELSPVRFLTLALRFILSPSLRQPYTVALTESQLLLSRAGATSTVQWPSVRAAVETDHLFTLVLLRALPVAIPKAQLPSPHTADSVRSFLATVTPVVDARTPPSPLFGA